MQYSRVCSVIALGVTALAACGSVPDIRFADVDAAVQGPRADATADAFRGDTGAATGDGATGSRDGAGGSLDGNAFGCPSAPPAGLKCCGTTVCKGDCDTAMCTACGRLSTACGGDEVCCLKSNSDPPQVRCVAASDAQNCR